MGIPITTTPEITTTPCPFCEIIPAGHLNPNEINGGWLGADTYEYTLTLEGEECDGATADSVSAVFTASGNADERAKPTTSISQISTSPNQFLLAVTTHGYQYQNLYLYDVFYLDVTIVIGECTYEKRYVLTINSGTPHF